MSFSESSFIIKNDGTLWACGQNNYGQLGLGDKSSRTTFTKLTANVNDVKSIYCGYRHAFILKNDGTLWGCGWNDYGQLGLGGGGSKSVFTQLTTNMYDVKSVYCGYSHTYVLKNDGTLWACGRNDYGQLGLGDVGSKNIFTQVTTNANDIKLICCGSYHTVILKNDNTLWGCGFNGYGQLGLGNTTNQKIFTQIATDIKSVYCGGGYTLILKNDGTLWGSGNNQYGQLGLGDTTNRKVFTRIITNTDDIKSIYYGQYHTIILKNDGTLWGCGYNNYGELGVGDTTCKYTFTQAITNVDNIKCFANDYPDLPNIIKIYDSKIGCTETLDANNFRNIPVDKFEKLKVLYTNPVDTYLNCLISFDKKQTWKTFDGLNWNTISDVSPQNIISNGMELIKVSQLSKSKLIAGGFTGDLDFKIAMKTNNKTVTSSVTKIYIEYK